MADFADPSCEDGWRGVDLGNLVSSQTRRRRIRRRAVATDSVRRGRRSRRRRPSQPLAHPHTHATSSERRGGLHVRPPRPTSRPRALPNRAQATGSSVAYAPHHSHVTSRPPSSCSPCALTLLCISLPLSPPLLPPFGVHALSSLPSSLSASPIPTMAPPCVPTSSTSSPAFAATRVRLPGAQVFAALRGSLAGRPPPTTTTTAAATISPRSTRAASTTTAGATAAAAALPVVMTAGRATSADEEQVVRLVLDLPGRFIG